MSKSFAKIVELDTDPEWVIHYINALVDMVRVIRHLKLASPKTCGIAYDEIKQREATLIPQFRSRLW